MKMFRVEVKHLAGNLIPSFEIVSSTLKKPYYSEKYGQILVTNPYTDYLFDTIYHD